MLTLAVALSPVLVIGAVQWAGAVDRGLERRQSMMKLVAEDAAQRSEIILSTAPALLDVIDTLAPEALCSPKLSAMIDRYRQFSSFTVVDANGFPICSTITPTPGATAARRDWFRHLLSSGDEYIQSEAYFSEATQAWIITIAKRRSGPDGAFNGATAIGTPVTSLAFSLDRSGLPPDSEIALLNPSGKVFASRYWAMLDPATMARVTESRGGFFRVRAEQGGDRDIAVVPFASGPVFALLSAPTPTPIALDNLSAFGNFALPLFAWLLALITAWLATDRLVLRWLDYLRRIAGLYASGKLQVQPIRAREQAPMEIKVLADTMEDMAVNIRDRTTGLEDALRARDAAMKEIHHRVKNNLQIINSLLSLQSRKVTDPAALGVLNDIRGRINALSLIHRSLYEHNDIRSVSVKTFLDDLANQLDQALGAAELGIHVGCRADDDVIDADFAVPLALFTAEAVTNAIRHAFPDDRRGRVMVDYLVGPNEAVLSVRDDGIGTDSALGGGLGGTLMAAFAKQARGQLEESRLPGGGHAIAIRMPRVVKPVEQAAQPVSR